jgi:hypothetical protein
MANAATKALATLSSPKSTYSTAEVALVLMKNAAKVRATAEAGNPKGTSGATARLNRSSTAEKSSAPNQTTAYKVDHTINMTT